MESWEYFILECQMTKKSAKWPVETLTETTETRILVWIIHKIIIHLLTLDNITQKKILIW